MRKIFRALLLLPALLWFCQRADADVFYRETFNYCTDSGSLASALSASGWTALTSGHSVGKPSTLKIQPVGAGKNLAAVASLPSGPFDGNAYWNRQSKGLHLFTAEITFDVSQLAAVSWSQRIDRQEKEFPNYGARLALLIGNTWYISDYSATQKIRGRFERRRVAPHLLTYGTSPLLAGVGIAAAKNSGVRLPETGLVRAFGLFMNRNFEKVRIDDFTLIDSSPAGTHAPDLEYHGCDLAVPNPNIIVEDPGLEELPPDDLPFNPPPAPAAPAPVVKGACEDGVDNDDDGLVDLDDKGCKSSADLSEDGGIPPQPPTELYASDGTSDQFVSVTWTAVSDAHHYRLYRSQFGSGSGDLIASDVVLPSFDDTSAVPGVAYTYFVTAVNIFEDESAPSPTDRGYRFSPLSDNDGDGVLNEQEQLDGTDINDPGSFRLHLRSPAYTKYNSFIDQWSFLELVSSGTKPISARVSLLSASGETILVRSVEVAPRTQLDLDMNRFLIDGCSVPNDACKGLVDLDGNGVVDAYGVVKIEFNDSNSDPGADLTGRMSTYRPNAAEPGYSFAFARELRNPTQGTSYAGANTYDPQGRGYVVANWLEIVNLEPVAEEFDFLLWTQDGELARRYSVVVPPFGERDLQAGHEILDRAGKIIQSAYLVEVRPKDGAAKYFSAVSRYSSKAPPGVRSIDFQYAFALDSVAGSGAAQLSPATNVRGTCSADENWIEVMNVREVPISAQLRFRTEAGREVFSTNVVFQPKSQIHFNASALLGAEEKGSVVVDGAEPGSFVTQSLVYVHDCANQVATAYAVAGRAAGRDVQLGSVNTYLDTRNELYLISAADAGSAVGAIFRPFDKGEERFYAYPFAAFSTGVFALSDVQTLGVLPDVYGALSLQTLVPNALTAGVLRIRRNADGSPDFVMPTAVQ